MDLLHRDHPQYLPAEQVHDREAGLQSVLAAAAKIQVISHWCKDRLTALNLAPPGKVFVARPYLHRRWHAQAPSALPSRPPCFLYPANFWPHKNHETLLVAYRIYRSACRSDSPTWPLILTGSPGERQEYLRHLVAVLRLEGVHFVGHVSDAQLFQLYHSAGATVFPSVYEGFGMPLLEAMELGCPIITGDFGAISETVGDAALLTDSRQPASLAAQMIELATNQELRSTLAQRGRTRAASCLPQPEFEHVIEALNQIAGDQQCG